MDMKKESRRKNKVTLIQKHVNNIIGPKIDLFDWIRGETLDEIAAFLEKMKVPFAYLPDLLQKPDIYPGKTIGLEQIIERFLNVTISRHYKIIQDKGLPIKFVLNMVRKNLFQGGWSVNRYSIITMATRRGDDAQKDIFTSRIDEPPRLISIKKKVHKAKSKPKPKKRVPKVKTIKKGKVKTPNICKEGTKINQCDYCGAYIKIRYTSNFIHVNICQNPKTHYFCSKECKINWIFAPLEKKVRLLEGQN